MSRIKTTTLLKIEDVPSDLRQWMGKIIQPINDFLNQATKIINDGLVFPDNFIGKDILFSFKFQTGQTLPLKYNWPLKTRPNALQVVAAYENDAPIICLVAWQQAVDGSIQLTDVKKISGTSVSALTDTNSYVIRVRVTP